MLTNTTPQHPHQEVTESGWQLRESSCLFSFFTEAHLFPFLQKWSSSKEAKLHSLVQALKKIWCHFGILESCLPTRSKQIAFQASLITEYTLVISCKSLSSDFIASSCPSRLVASLPECSPLPACLNTHHVCWIKSFWLGLDPPSLARNSCLRNIRAILIRHDSALLWPLFSFSLIRLVHWSYLWNYVPMPPSSHSEFQEGKFLSRGIFRRFYHGILAMDGLTPITMALPISLSPFCNMDISLLP